MSLLQTITPASSTRTLPFLLQLVTLFAITALSVPADAQNAWINEFHYNNNGTDADEFVEIVIEQPANYDLNQFTVYLYNGNGGTIDDSETINNLSVGAKDGLFTTYMWHPSSIQNGPDGIAVSYNDSILHFISYGGSFLATEGPAVGKSSIDIGIQEPDATPIGQSLQLTGSGGAVTDLSWTGPATASPGAFNTGQALRSLPLQVVPIPSEAAPGDTIALTFVVGTQEVPAVDIVGLGFQMDYDPSLFSVVGSAPGTFFTSDTLVFSRIDREAGEIAYGITKKNPTSGRSGVDTLITYQLRVLDVPSPDTTITFEMYDMLATDLAGTAIKLTPIHQSLALTVGPAISLSDTMLTFGVVDISTPATKQFFVKNDGGTVLSISNVSSDQPMFTAAPSSFTIPPGDSQAVAVTFNPTSTDSISAAITVYTSDPTLSDPVITATGQGAVFVWPGDTDNNGTVNVLDVLPLGQYFGLTGPSRTPGVQWEAKQAQPWAPIPATYADATGNGLISQNDIQPIGFNYDKSRTVSKTSHPLEESLALQQLPVGADVTVSVTIPSNRPVSNMLGIALALAYPADMLRVTDLHPSAWVDNHEMLQMERIDGRYGTLAAAYTRKRGAKPMNGSGTLVTVRFKVIGDMQRPATISITNAATSTANSLNTAPAVALISNRAVATESAVELPDRFTVHGNYPNPFNGATTFLIDLPEQAIVSGRVYNTLGQAVLTLPKRSLPAGAGHPLTVDAASLPSGMYFYRIVARMAEKTRQASGTFTLLK